jgi:hypothetical protein
MSLSVQRRGQGIGKNGLRRDLKEMHVQEYDIIEVKIRAELGS